MRAIIFLVTILMVVMISVAAGATDNELTVVITGSKVGLDEPTTITLDGATIEGLIEQKGTSYIVQKRTDVRLDPPADQVVIHRLKRSKGIFGQTCLLGGDDSSIEVLEDVSTLGLGPGEVAEVTWRLPEMIMKETELTTEIIPPVVVKLPPEYPDGKYLRLYWRGEYVDDPIPVVDVRFPVRWEPVSLSVMRFDRILYQWELWGIERYPSTTIGTDQPALPLGWAPSGKELMLQTHDGTIPPAGELTLYLLQRGISQIQSGYCPRLELRICENPRPQAAILTRHNGEWVWLGG